MNKIHRVFGYVGLPAIVGIEDAARLVAQAFDRHGLAFGTITPSFGIWKGTLERSLEVKYDTGAKEEAEAVFEALREVGRTYRQDYIWVGIDNEGWLIEC